MRTTATCSAPSPRPPSPAPRRRPSRPCGGFTDLDKTLHLSYGDYPAREYLTHIS